MLHSLVSELVDNVLQMQEDISVDHMAKTVTIDPFPHINKLLSMSIHPCKHANTMKIFGDQQVLNGKEFPVQHYLILFLKFISGVVPTIEYDYSMEYAMS
jgi:ubiquitin-like-conjugating enzyme ATG3